MYPKSKRIKGILYLATPNQPKVKIKNTLDLSKYFSRNTLILSTILSLFLALISTQLFSDKSVYQSDIYFSHPESGGLMALASSLGKTQSENVSVEEFTTFLTSFENQRQVLEKVKAKVIDNPDSFNSEVLSNIFSVYNAQSSFSRDSIRLHLNGLLRNRISFKSTKKEGLFSYSFSDEDYHTTKLIGRLFLENSVDYFQTENASRNQEYIRKLSQRCDSIKVKMSSDLKILLKSTDASRALSLKQDQYKQRIIELDLEVNKIAYAESLKALEIAKSAAAGNEIGISIYNDLQGIIIKKAKGPLFVFISALASSLILLVSLNFYFDNNDK